MENKKAESWWVFSGSGEPHNDIERLLGDHSPPPWRDFAKRPNRQDVAPISRQLNWEAEKERGQVFRFGETEKEHELISLINTALYLRRPMLVTGKPGSGKSSLAYALAYELRLGPVLRWSITTRTTLNDGLYSYDAIGRLQDTHLQQPEKGGLFGASTPKLPPPDIGNYLHLGPLGTALLPTNRPRVLLIDEIDKSDIDLPNDLLHIFEEGEFVIPELERMAKNEPVVHVQPDDSADSDSDSQNKKKVERVPIHKGKVCCLTFPIVVLTSNAERDFPQAFLRRCLRLDMPEPTEAKLRAIVQAHLGEADRHQVEQLIQEFLKRQKGEKGERGDRSTDQLLNAVYLATRGIDPVNALDKEQLLEVLLKPLQ